MLAGALLTLFFAWNVAQSVRRAKSKTKHSGTPRSSDIPIFKLINGTCSLMIEHFVFPVMAGFIV